MVNFSVYLEIGDINEAEFGVQAVSHAGLANLEEILQAEVNTKNRDMNQNARMLVTGKEYIHSLL